MITSPVPGQPTAAYTATPHRGRAAMASLPTLVALGGVLVAIGGVLVAIPLALSGTWSAAFAVTLLVSTLLVLGLVGSYVLLWQDRRNLTQELQRSRATASALVKSSPEPVVILDDRLRVTFASPSLVELLGIAPADAVGRPITRVVHADDAPGLRDALSGPPSESPELTVRTARVRHADGRWRLIQATIRDLRADPDVGALVARCRDVTSTAPGPGADPELVELALTDPVTGLPNRAALVRRLGALQRAATGQPYALALIGVTGLPPDLLPDTAAAVLRTLASRVSRVLRAEDWLALGADGDFVVVVTGTVADAEVLAARVVAVLGPLAVPGGALKLSAAAGVTTLPADVDAGAALRRADLALHSAQAAGSGVVHRYEDALRLEQDRRSALLADLEGALARGELRLVFQPVVDVVLHHTVCVEALLRWRHPTLGEVSPIEFVPLAEETALIAELGRWALAEACRIVAGLDALPGEPLSVAVNISARHVRNGELVPDVLAALGSSGLPASRLVVEITESVLLDDAHVIEDLAALRRLGVRIAVDDFGTGWSSLAYLVGMPVDVLKMDQYFLAGVEHDPARRAMCRAVLQLASSLDLPVVVEGVTNQAVLELLRDMGHRYLQGYALSRPLEVGQLAAGEHADLEVPPAARTTT